MRAAQFLEGAQTQTAYWSYTSSWKIDCRHSHQPWDKELRNPWVDENGNPIIDTEESRKIYEDQQKARAMERAIRKTKRELLMKEEEMKNPGDMDPEKLKADYDRLSYKLREQNKRYDEFCTQTGIPKQQERIKVAGFKAAQSRKANGAATRYQNNILKANANHISKSITAEDIYGSNINGNIRKDVLDNIRETLVEKDAMKCYDGVEVKHLDTSDFMITDTRNVGTWCKNTLIINSKFFNGQTIKELNEIMESTKNTKCNSLHDAVTHEIYHAKLAYSMNYAKYKALCDEQGIMGISVTAAKDLSETIAEVGMMYDRGDYDLVPEEAKLIFERYFKVDKG